MAQPLNRAGPDRKQQIQRLAASRRVAQMTPSAVFSQMLATTEERLRAAPGDPRLERRRADLLRELGDLAAARRAYAALATAPVTAKVLTILSGDPVGWTGRAGPVPFVRIKGFLNPEELQRLWDEVADPLAVFVPATVNGSEGERVDRQLRDARVLSRSGPIRRWFMPRLEALVEEARVLPRLGLEPFEIGERIMQVTRHDHGGLLWPHRDRGSVHRLRQLSYVYYFHREPRRFEGGDLLLFDDPDVESIDDSTAFTRITPENNSLILFPPDRLHCVTRVTINDGDALDGRWTVNGWLHRSDEP